MMLRYSFEHGEEAASFEKGVDPVLIDPAR